MEKSIDASDHWMDFFDGLEEQLGRRLTPSEEKVILESIEPGFTPDNNVLTPRFRAFLAWKWSAMFAGHFPNEDVEQYISEVASREESGSWFLGSTDSTYAGIASLLATEAALCLNAGETGRKAGEELLKTAVKVLRDNPGR